MAIITCHECGKMIDTDETTEFQLINNEFVCDDCVEELEQKENNIRKA